MTYDLESALKQLLTNVIREVAGELVEELKASARHQVAQAKPADEAFLLTARETAKRLAISERHLFRLTRLGQIPSVRVGNSVRYNVETIQKWIRETECTEPSTRTEGDDSKQTTPTAATSSTRNSEQNEGKEHQGSAREQLPIWNRRSPKVRKSSNGRPKDVQSEERTSPLSVLFSELGIEKSSLPPITFGELRRIAEVDIATMHGWQSLNRPLPDEAMNKLRNHFQCLVNERKVGE